MGDLIENIKIKEWNNAYTNKDNFIFYPQEDIVRFISKYIRKRIGLNEFVDQNIYNESPKVLDFGCGIGRHVKLLHEFKLDGYGFDLSNEAIDIAKDNFKKQNLSNIADKMEVANIINLPYEDNFFDFMLSHGVLDSMPYTIAKKGMHELHRCLKNNGKIYLDLISTSDHTFNGRHFERTVSEKHEKGTIQLYFDKKRINALLVGLFRILEISEKINFDLVNKIKLARYHIVIEKIQ